MQDDLRMAIHEKIVELARRIGNNASKLKYDEEIPASGLLDSALIMELILWLETHFGIEIEHECLTLENFGTIDAMARYLEPISRHLTCARGKP
jgi:acyl carrier protein